ncbi:pentapeptide repeat-containing protein [Streptomyces sp. NPDC032472]|uniref:pentapeptide repeat-containing protein n=1 Tax=Streptomyces sp. NPDC032472 TaxID=3155018 RepID=UPI0033CE8CCA
MAGTVNLEWDACGVTSCIGIRAEGMEGCLLHDKHHLEAALKRVSEDGHIDARGVRISGDLLGQLLAAARKRDHMPVLQDVRFDRASFPGPVSLGHVTFKGRSWFAGAEFGSAVNFEGATFEDEARFDGVSFNKEATFRNTTFSRIWFDDATFGAAVSFAEAAFTGWTWFGGATFKGAARFHSATFEDEARFDVATFQDEAWFEKATFKDDVWFGSNITFGGRAEFHAARFCGLAGFAGTVFEDDAWFVGAAFENEARFDGAIFKTGAGFESVTFDRAKRLGPILLRGWLLLDDSVFKQRIRIEASVGTVRSERAQFPAGVHFRLRWAQVILDDADLAAPAILAGVPSIKELHEDDLLSGWWPDGPGGPPRPPGQPWVASLRRADVAGLAFANVDLQAAQFAGAHNLDRLRLESPKAFTATPGLKAGWAWPPLWWWTRRQTLAEEHAWRATHERGIRQAGWHAGGSWPAGISHWVHRPPHPAHDRARTECHGARRRQANREQQAQEIANLYRALRKAREDAKDEPGAADFYYGEMEMRRHAAPRFSIERAVLTLYWLTAGYALRAWRAFAALTLVLMLAAWLLAHHHGYAKPQVMSFWGALRYSGGTAIGLPLGIQPALTPWGEVLQIAVRVVIPVLLGLAVLSIRGRVKR